MAFSSQSVRSHEQSLPFQAVLQSINEPIFVLSVSGKVVFWNDASARLTGLAVKKVLGTNEHWRGVSQPSHLSGGPAAVARSAR